MCDCIFCKIVKGEAPSYKIYEDDYAYAFLDISKDCYGHTLVIPKQHYKNVLDCNEKVLQHVISATQKVAKHYTENCGFKAVNILNASGEEAEQMVNHLHFHILPRTSKDEFTVYPKLCGTIAPFEQQQEHLKFNN